MTPTAATLTMKANSHDRFSAAPGKPMCKMCFIWVQRTRQKSDHDGAKFKRLCQSSQCKIKPTKRLMTSATAKPGKPIPGQSEMNFNQGAPCIRGQARLTCTACITNMTHKVSRVRKCARMTLAMQAFQASNSKANDKACNSGTASANTSGGALSSCSKGVANNKATTAMLPPIHVPAANAARATRSASANCLAPRF